MYRSRGGSTGIRHCRKSEHARRAPGAAKQTCTHDIVLKAVPVGSEMLTCRSAASEEREKERVIFCLGQKGTLKAALDESSLPLIVAVILSSTALKSHFFVDERNSGWVYKQTGVHCN
jgi:hypothetical protein